MTYSAAQFVRPETIRWFADEVFTSDSPELNPVEVALAADAIVVLPATANILACAALGLLSSPATTALAAHPRRCLFFPHMNVVLWDRLTTQRHVEALRYEGHTVADPLRREVFEIRRKDVGLGATMPGIPDAVRIIQEWLATERAAHSDPKDGARATKADLPVPVSLS
jgi:phosphopantothenoylcysteine decarboxylase/phosphopantothenate--cysteine ligase